MKYKIEKNTVRETLVIPLYGRKMCSELYPKLYSDKTASQLMEKTTIFRRLRKSRGALCSASAFLSAQ